MSFREAVGITKGVNYAAEVEGLGVVAMKAEGVE